jgi:hypothetical protein
VAVVGHVDAQVVNVVGFTAASNAVVAASWALLLVSMGGLAARSEGLRPAVARA